MPIDGIFEGATRLPAPACPGVPLPDERPAHPVMPSIGINGISLPEGGKSNINGQASAGGALAAGRPSAPAARLGVPSPLFGTLVEVTHDMPRTVRGALVQASWTGDKE